MRRLIAKTPKFLTRNKYRRVSQTLNLSVDRVVKFWLRSTVVGSQTVSQAGPVGDGFSRAEYRRQMQLQKGFPRDQPLALTAGQGGRVLTEKDIHSLTRDFLELYEMNSSVIQMVNISSYRVHEKTYVFSPQERYSWYVSSVDSCGKLSKYEVTPSQLGHSLEAMFGVVKTDKIVEPELLMALCRHYEMMWQQ